MGESVRETEFQAWIRSKSGSRPYYVSGHRFEKDSSGSVVIDKGKFDLEEAEEIGIMFMSMNPIARFTAQIAVWEKNGTLVKGVLVIAIVLLVMVILFLRR